MAIATVASLAAHAVALVAIFSANVSGPPRIEPEPVMLELVQPEPPPPPPQEPTKAPAPKAPPKTAKNTPHRTQRPAPPSHIVEPIAARPAPKLQMAVEVADSDLVGAATAGSGGSGGGCNMVRLLQAALRKDAAVQAALAEAQQAGTGKAMLVWNGDWVQHPSQDGHGLATIRQAILVEVGFAPAACKAEPMRGMVVISLSDAPGSPRVALGGGSWRWQDMLFARGTRG
jgi:hypothetical protein